MGSAGAWGFRQAILDLCRFFRGYDPADVLLRLRSGNLLLEDVELDPAQFDSLALPFTMTNGRVGRLEVSGVWSNVLKGTPVRIEIRDVEVHVSSREWEDVLHSLQQSAEKSNMNRLRTILAGDLERRLRENDSTAWERTAGKARQVTGILRGASISVLNVHLRFSSSSSNLEDAEAPLFVIGMRLASLEAIAESKGKCESTCTFALPVKQQIEAQGLEAYWHCGSNVCVGYEKTLLRTTGTTASMAVRSRQECDHRGFDALDPALSISIDVGEISTFVSPSFVRASTKAASRAALCAARAREALSACRPLARPAARGRSSLEWWHYALRRVMMPQGGLKRDRWTMPVCGMTRAYIEALRERIRAGPCSSGSERNGLELAKIEGYFGILRTLAIRDRVFALERRQRSAEKPDGGDTTEQSSEETSSEKDENGSTDVRAEEDALRAWNEIGADISDSGAAVLSPGEVLWEVALRGGTLRAVFDTEALDCDEGTESSGAVLDICGVSVDCLVKRSEKLEAGLRFMGKSTVGSIALRSRISLPDSAVENGRCIVEGTRGATVGDEDGTSPILTAELNLPWDRDLGPANEGNVRIDLQGLNVALRPEYFQRTSEWLDSAGAGASSNFGAGLVLMQKDLVEWMSMAIQSWWHGARVGTSDLLREWFQVVGMRLHVSVGRFRISAESPKGELLIEWEGMEGTSDSARHSLSLLVFALRISAKCQEDGLLKIIDWFETLEVADSDRMVICELHINNSEKSNTNLCQGQVQNIVPEQKCFANPQLHVELAGLSCNLTTKLLAILIAVVDAYLPGAGNATRHVVCRGTVAIGGWGPLAMLEATRRRVNSIDDDFTSRQRTVSKGKCAGQNILIYKVLARGFTIRFGALSKDSRPPKAHREVWIAVGVRGSLQGQHTFMPCIDADDTMLLSLEGLNVSCGRDGSQERGGLSCIRSNLIEARGVVKVTYETHAIACDGNLRTCLTITAPDGIRGELGIDDVSSLTHMAVDVAGILTCTEDTGECCSSDSRNARDSSAPNMTGQGTSIVSKPRHSDEIQLLHRIGCSQHACCTAGQWSLEVSVWAMDIEVFAGHRGWDGDERCESFQDGFVVLKVILSKVQIVHTSEWSTDESARVCDELQIALEVSADVAADLNGAMGDRGMGSSCEFSSLETELEPMLERWPVRAVLRTSTNEPQMIDISSPVRMEVSLGSGQVSNLGRWVDQVSCALEDAISGSITDSRSEHFEAGAEIRSLLSVPLQVQVVGESDDVGTVLETIGPGVLEETTCSAVQNLSKTFQEPKFKGQGLLREGVHRIRLRILSPNQLAENISGELHGEWSSALPFEHGKAIKIKVDVPRMLGLDRLEDAAVRPSEVSDGPLGEVVVAFSGSGRNGLVVCPSWQLQNLLPQSVRIHFLENRSQSLENDSDQNEIGSVTIPAGCTRGMIRSLCKHDLFLEVTNDSGDGALLRTTGCLHLGEQGVTSGQSLPEEIAMDVEDADGQVSVGCLRIVWTTSAFGQRLAVLFAPWVMVNRTQLDIMISRRDYIATAAVSRGVDQDAEALSPPARPVTLIAGQRQNLDDEAKPVSWHAKSPSILPFSLSSHAAEDVPAATSEVGLSLRGSRYWTFLGPRHGIGDGIAPSTSITAAFTLLPPGVHDEKESCLQIGVHIQAGEQPFQRTTYLTLLPRITLVNNVGITLEVRSPPQIMRAEELSEQDGIWEASGRGQKVAAGDTLVFNGRGETTSSSGAVQFRTIGTDGKPQTAWTGVCSVLRSKEVAVRLRDLGRSIAERIIVLEVKVFQGVSIALIREMRNEEEGLGVQVDNVCGYVDVSVWQRGSPLGPEHSVLVATEERRNLVLDEPDLPAVLVVQPAMLDAFEVDLRVHGSQGLLPTRDGLDTFIHYTVALVGRTRVLRLACKVGRDAAIDRQPPSEMEVRIGFDGVGLSLLDRRRSELLYASLQGIHLTMVATAPAIDVTFTVSAVQIDNQTDFGPPIALLAPAIAVPEIRDGASWHEFASSWAVGTGKAMERGASIEVRKMQPFLNIEGRLLREVRTLSYWERLAVAFSPAEAIIEEEWLFALVQWEADVFRANLSTQQNDLAHEESFPVDPRTGLWRAEEARLRSLAFFDEEYNGASYLQEASVAPTYVRLTLFGLSAIPRRCRLHLRSSPGPATDTSSQDHHTRDFNAGAGPLAACYSVMAHLAGEMPIPDLEGHIIPLPVLKLREVILGDPEDAARTFVEPYRLRGTAQVVGALGLAGSATVWGSLLDQIGEEDAAQLAAQRGRAERRGAGSLQPRGLRDGFSNAGNKVWEGLRGAVTRPLDGAREAGVSGFLQGVGRGAVGLVAKPAVAMMQLGEEVGKVNRSTLMVGARQRPPRPVYADGRARKFSLLEAEVQEALSLRRMDGGSLLGAAEAEAIAAPTKSMGGLRKQVAEEQRSRAAASESGLWGSGLGLGSALGNLGWNIPGVERNFSNEKEGDGKRPAVASPGRSVLVATIDTVGIFLLTAGAAPAGNVVRDGPARPEHWWDVRMSELAGVELGQDKTGGDLLILSTNSATHPVVRARFRNADEAARLAALIISRVKNLATLKTSEQSSGV